MHETKQKRQNSEFSLIDHLIWRLARWILPVASFVLHERVFIPPAGEISTFSNISILISLIIPEAMRFFPYARITRWRATLICDMAWVSICVWRDLGGNPFIFTLVIILLMERITWPVTMIICLIGVGIIWGRLILRDNFSDFFIAQTIMDSLVFILSGGMLTYIGSQIKALLAANREMQAKINLRSDHYLMRAHEIRTPLTLIQASVELVLDGTPGPLTSKQREFLEDVEENCRYIAILTENMLTRGKLESGVFEPVYETIDLRDIIKPVVADMHTLAQRRKQAIRTYYPKFLPTIQGDPILLRQTFTNLVLNAIRHTSCSARIVVSVAANDKGATVSVTDDGAGMSVDQRRQLFQRFATDGKGTGLGLLIVKQSVELHGGKVYVDTSLGRGTTFFLTFPFEAVGEDVRSRS